MLRRMVRRRPFVVVPAIALRFEDDEALRGLAIKRQVT